MRSFPSVRRFAAIPLLAAAALLGGGSSALLGTCGPFTDTANDTFCAFVLEVFYMGITTGTTPTTYDPTSAVTRLQMAAFLSRSADRVLQRGSRRAALKQFWTPQSDTALGLTTVGGNPQLVESDGAELWVANFGDGTVSRVRGNDGRPLETWTGAGSAYGVLVASGSVFVIGNSNPGSLYKIDPTQAAGAVTTVATNLGNGTLGIAFDGSRIWTASFGSAVSIVTPGATIPWTVTTVTTGFFSPVGPLFDGANVWVADFGSAHLLKLDGAGAILQTVTVGSFPEHPVFDGTNIWVPSFFPNSVSVVRASSGAVLATLTGNGLNHPFVAAFDGQRVLVTNHDGNSVSLWKAADLTPLGSFPTGTSTGPTGACSDGVNFWITLRTTNKLARF